jgi:hypothetical protein
MCKVTKKVMILAGITTLVLLVSSSFSFVPDGADGNGAIVINHSDGIVFVWSYWDGSNWNKYAGQISIVITPSGKLNAQWNAKLVSGNPVEKKTKVDIVLYWSPFEAPGTIVLTPSGHANGTWHF